MSIPLWEKFMCLIYPERCPYCQKAINSGEACCSDCAKSIKREICVKLVIEDVSGFSSFCISPLCYKGDVKRAIWRFKFKGYRRYANQFSAELVNAIKQKLPDAQFEGVTYVPLTKARERERGYNQSRLLAEEVSEKLQIPFIKLLAKVRNNLPQHEIEAELRSENVKGVYSCIYPTRAKSGVILLCDDIITTGNTLKECVSVLHRSGYRKVMCITIAYI